MSTDALKAQAERTALRIILSNVVAQLVVAHSSDPMERRARLQQMSDDCKLAAHQAMSSLAGQDRQAFLDLMFEAIDEFYKGITIT